MKRAAGVIAIIWACWWTGSAAAKAPNTDWMHKPQHAAEGPAVAPDEPEITPGHGPTAAMHEQILKIPGDPGRPVSLVVTVMTADGPGPFRWRS
jgi:hypothetical protein